MTFRGISRFRLAVLAWVVAWALGGIATVRRTQTAVVRLQRVPDLGFFDLNGFSREATDFQWVLRVPGAESRLARLVSEGSPAAKDSTWSSRTDSSRRVNACLRTAATSPWEDVFGTHRAWASWHGTSRASARIYDWSQLNGPWPR